MCTAAQESQSLRGRREAALLAKAAPSPGMDHCFVSPLGRVQETAAYRMKSTGMTTKTLDWLEEFDAPVDLNKTPELLAACPNVQPEPAKSNPGNPPAENETKYGALQGASKSGIFGKTCCREEEKGFPRGDVPGKGDILTPGLYRLRKL